MLGRNNDYKGNRISPPQMIMMVMLREQPMYGYELIKALREEYAGLWEPQTGAVYPALRRLQEHGLLTVEMLEGKDHYALSPEGEKWINETISSVNVDMLFMAKTMEIVVRAFQRSEAGMMASPKFITHEERSPEDRLRILRHIRETMLTHLENIERDIEQLSKEEEE